MNVLTGGYLVEFMTALGKTVTVIEVYPDQVRSISEWEMSSSRAFEPV